MEVDGQRLAESSAICRFLAKRFKLTGSNEWEAAKCDEYVDSMMDLRTRKFQESMNKPNTPQINPFMFIDWRAYFWESDTTKKAELKKVFLETQVPNYLSKFEKLLESSGGPFLLGKNFTWADLHIGHTLAFYEETVDPSILSAYPKVKGLRDEVYNIPQIKKWVEQRPKNDM